MNKVCRVVWNKSKGVFQVASELAQRGTSNSASSGVRGLIKRIAAGTLLLIAVPVYASSLPSGGQVVAGQGSINSSSNTLTVNQSSQNMAINWQDFSIAEGHTVNFVQPNSQAAALNRVTGNNVSDIRGALNANGRVFLVNPNGVMFSSTAKVDVGSLVASTLDISTEDFMAGNYQFEGASANAIINQGNITTAANGVVAMIAARIINTGSITTPGGSTLMGAGSKVVLDLGGPLKIEVEEALLDTYIEQGGAIRADGGLVYLTAKAAGNLASSVINHTGVTEARTLAAGADGRIMLMGDMEHGQVQVAGTLDASAPTAGNGGFIETSAAKVAINDVQVTTRAENGQTGEWLIDPNDYTVAASGGDISGAQLGSNLGSTNITIKSVEGANNGNGDVFVNDAVTWSSGNTLTLNAIRNIEINASIDASGGSGGKLVLQYGQAGLAENNTAQYFINAPVSLQAGQNFSTKQGSDDVVDNWTVITDATALQNMATAENSRTALGTNIDLYGVAWTPIARLDGKFDGLGHTISNMTINNPTVDFQGFFGRTGVSAVISNFNLSNISVSGKDYVGGAVGLNTGSLSNVSVQGEVTGNSFVGGIIAASTSGNGNRLANLHRLFSNVTTSGNQFVGGVVGSLGLSNLSSSYAIGNVSGTGNQIGGLVGLAGSGSPSSPNSISNSYATGAVVGANQVGGLVGTISNGKIINSYASNTVTATGSLVGGLVSSGFSIAYSTASYYDKTINAATMTDSVLGRTTEQMYSASTYQDWDTSVWSFGTGRAVEGYGISRAYLTNVTRAEDRPEQSTLFAGGWGGLTGTEQAGANGSAYTITTAQQLQNVNTVASQRFDFELVNDLSLKDFTWTAIGRVSKQFNGTFDGRGHRVSGLSINKENADHQGLFGYAWDATIENINLVDVDITGKDYIGALVGYAYNTHIENVASSGNVAGNDYVGGLVGYMNDSVVTVKSSYSSANVSGADAVGGLVGQLNGSRIEHSYATGDVVATDGSAGGLVGFNQFATIVNAYATGAVSGNQLAGGLVGFNRYSTIENTYATGEVTGAGDIGGLAGGAEGGTITSSFWNTQTSGLTTSYGGEGKTTSQLMNQLTYAGWDTTIWSFVSDSSVDGYGLGLAYLTGVTREQDIVISGRLFNSGFGTEENPYTLANWTQLQNINYAGDTSLLSKYYVLSNNLDSSSAGFSDFNEVFVKHWTPIGNDVVSFTGSFDGLGNTISGLYIYKPFEDYQGLFGHTSDAIIKNIKLNDIFIKAQHNVGALVGVADNTQIENVSAVGEVIGVDNVGGLVGYMVGPVATINNSFSSVAVTGERSVGGLVGGLSNSTIEQSYATGSVHGINERGFNVGGLIGASEGSTLKNTYATGDVVGNFKVGGLVGYMKDSLVNTSYTTGETNGIHHGASFSDSVGGLAGHSLNSIVRGSYSLSSVTGTHKVGGLVGHFQSNNSKTSIIEDSYYYGGLSTYSQSTTSGRLIGVSEVDRESKININRVFAAGAISGEIRPAGFIGVNEITGNGTITIAGAFFDTKGEQQSIGNDPDATGIIGKTIFELMDFNIFNDAGWDIQADSRLDPDLPFLAWGNTSSGYTQTWVIGTKGVSTGGGGNPGGGDTGGDNSGGGGNPGDSNPDGGNTGGNSGGGGSTDGDNIGGDNIGGGNFGHGNEALSVIAALQQSSSGLTGASTHGTDFGSAAMWSAMSSSASPSIYSQENHQLSGGLELVDTEEATITEQSGRRDQSGLLPVFVVDGGIRLNNTHNSNEL